ncbi:MAG TPA: dynamin family protein [Chloroflexota bacterium]|nr:dynamin family protein [Chloroflexota bacterium]
MQQITRDLLSHTIPVARLRELAADALLYAPAESAALQRLLDQPEITRLSPLAAIAGTLAALRAAVLTADTDEAAGLWYDLVAASEDLRGPFIDTFRAAPADRQEALISHIAHLAGSTADGFAAVRGLLDRDDLVVAAAGDFKRGKSTVINALLGRQILPTRVAPATAVPCLIRAGSQPGAHVFYNDGRPAETISLDALERYACIALPGQDGALAFQPAIARIEIDLPWSLPPGVALLDLPGLNEEEGRSEMATAALAQADAILMVLSATQLLAEDELLLLDQLWRQGYRYFLFAINFLDRLEGDEVDLVRERAAHLLAPYQGTLDATVFLISARRALQAQLQEQPAPADSGLPALESYLRRLLTDQRPALWRLSRIRQALEALETAEWEAARAVLAQQEAARQLRTQLAGAQAREAATERTQAARIVDGEAVVGACLRLLDEHEQRYDGAWEAIEMELQERCRRETLPWVWQLAGAWLRDRLVLAIRAVHPEVTPRPEGYLRIRVPPGLRLGRDALYAFYRDEAAREWERFTAAARRGQRVALEERLAAAEAAREQVRLESDMALATLRDQQAQLRGALEETSQALRHALPRALAAAGALRTALDAQRPTLL